jgi:surface carbohydrate biosynthesis protein
MTKLIKNLIHIFFRTKFYFKLPKKNKILLFDESQSSIFKETIKKSFNILHVRNKRIYFWIYLKQVFFFDFSFKTYCKNYIKFTSPKVIICFNDARYQMYEFKKSFQNVKFITVINGLRFNYWFKNNKKNWPKNLSCDYLFVLNKYYISEYKKILKSNNYNIFGQFRNNLVKIGNTKFNKEFLYISQVFDSQKTGINYKRMNFDLKLLNLINKYLANSNKKLHILLRRARNNPRQITEINFYKKIFNSNCVFHKKNNWKKNYELLDKFDNIIFTFSTMGYEAIARKKKVAIFTPTNHNGSSLYFGWPGPNKKKFRFFSTQNFNYKEVKRVLENVKNCSQKEWNKKYYPTVKDQCYFDKNNKSLANLINSLL